MYLVTSVLGNIAACAGKLCFELTCSGGGGTANRTGGGGAWIETVNGVGGLSHSETRIGHGEQVGSQECTDTSICLEARGTQVSE